MQNWKRWNNCTIFWWVAAAGLGLAAYGSIVGSVGIIVALLIAIVVTGFVGLGATRYFCIGPASGVNTGDDYTNPAIGFETGRPAVGPDTASIAAAAAKAATPAQPVVAPPAAKAPEAPAPVAKPAPAPKPKAEPAKTKAAPATPDYDGDGIREGTDEGTKPAALDGPRGGKADNLKEIKGIGPKLEKLCHSMGFYHFDQIAGWTADEVAWVDANLQGFKGRVSRDEWIAQAKILAAGGDTEFSKRVDDGDVY